MASAYRTSPFERRSFTATRQALRAPSADQVL